MKRSLGSFTRSLVTVALVAMAGAVISNSVILSAATPDVSHLVAQAERGSIRHEIQLGATYLAGNGVLQDLERAAYWYERAANSGDPLAQNQIGFFYQAGIGVPRDPKRAVEWFHRSASGGYLVAKVNLGVAYLWGLGVKKDEQMGFTLLSEAAARNCGLADAYLGKIFDFGLGVPVDQNAARIWYERGARLNDSMAQYGLAMLLSRENAPRHDLEKAVRLLQQSVNGGYVVAQHSLGLLMINHPELARTSIDAVGLLQNASAAGIWQSSAVLAILCRDGQGVRKDHAKARYYFYLAQLQGGERARAKIANELAVLSRELSAAELSKSDANADEWFRKHPLTLQFEYKDTVNLTDFPVYAISASSDDKHAGQLIPAPPAKVELN